MDKRNWTYKLTVLESYLDQSYDWAESADRYLTTDLAHTGIHSGFTAAQDPAGPNLNVQISGPGYAHDKVGRRLYESNATVLVDCEYDEYGIATAVTLASGKERWISIFVRFTTQYADSIVDGNGVTVYTKEYEDAEFFVRQAAETAAPSTTQVALQTEAILICDIKLTDGMTQIQNADIDSDRREDWIRLINPTTLTNLATQSFGTSLAAVDQIVQWVDALQVGTGIGFTGAATWHDTNTIAATTVSTAIEEIVTVLAVDTTTPGSDKIGSDIYIAGGTFTLAKGSVWDQLKLISDAIDISVQSNADENITGQWDFTNYVTIDCSAVATNTTAITCTANGTGDGGVFTGGDNSGTGVVATGGATNGDGINGIGDGTGVGVVGVGTGSATTIPAVASGAGVYGIGGAAGDTPGVVGIGGVASGIGGHFTGDGNGYGVLALGTGAADPGTAAFDGAGLVAVGSTTGDGHGAVAIGDGVGYGMLALGVGATDPLTAAFDGAGLVAVGSTTGDGYGAVAIGDGAGMGLYCLGGSITDANAAHGIDATGGTATDVGGGGDGGYGGYFTGGDGAGTGKEGGFGIYAEGGTADANEYGGVGVYAVGNVQRAPIRLVPQTAPTSGKTGDLFVHTTGMKLYVCTVGSKTAPTWVVVGSQIT